MIGNKDDQSLLVLAGFLQRFDQSPQSLVHTRNRLIVLSQFSATDQRVGQERWNDHIRGVETDLLDSLVSRGSVAKAIGQ